MRHSRLGSTLVMAALFVTFAAGSAGAAPAYTPPPRWQLAPQPQLTLPAGVLCAFSLRVDTVEDQVITKVLATWPDGSPRNQVYTGTYIARFTNVDSGRSVTRNLSGDALVHYGEDDGAASWSYAAPSPSPFSGARWRSGCGCSTVSSWSWSTTPATAPRGCPCTSATRRTCARPCADAATRSRQPRVIARLQPAR